MKVLHLSKYSNPISGGIEKVVYDLCSALSQKGHQSDVLAINDNSDVNSSFKMFLAKELFSFASAPISLAYVFLYLKRMRDYDFVQVHMPNPIAVLSVFVGSLLGFKGKIILHWHSDILKQKKLYLLFKPLERWILRRSLKIVTTTPIYGKESKPLVDFQDKVISIPIGVEVDYLHRALDAVNFKESHLLEPLVGKNFIFSLGRLVSYKGFHNLISAAKSISKDCMVVIAGGGPLLKDLQRQVTELNLTNKVILTGRLDVSVVAKLYSECKVFCLPSIDKTEAFGVVQVEAMSFRKPLVSSNIDGSGVSWVNMNGVTGITVAPNDPESLAEAINILVTDDELYANYSQQAYQRYQMIFTIENMSNGFTKLYNELNESGL